MEKKTVIANVHAELTLSPAVRGFLAQFSDRDSAWFAREDGDVFLREFGHEWNSEFVDVAQTVLNSFFTDRGLSESALPKVELTDWRRGSWIMEAAVTMFGAVGTTYTILKGIAELPELADGLEHTKKRLQKELSSRFTKKVPARIEPVLSNAAPPLQLPAAARASPITITCSIDARPMRGLAPDVAKSHSVHLAVAVSRSSLSVENLGETAIENLRIGLFKSPVPRHSWSFTDAFSKSVLRLSGGQSTFISIDQFKSEADGSTLDLDDGTGLHVDCWLQDNSGIYLFNFFLE